MAGHHLSSSRHAPAEVYLSQLASRLRGPRRHRARILTEIRDGLQHAIDKHLAQGATETEAAIAAIADFGTPEAVAGAFAGELATAYARRTIMAYIVTGPLVGIWWLLQQPYPWRSGLIALLAAIPVIPMIAVILATAVITLATTGSLIRWLPEAQPRRVLTVTLAIAALVLAADFTVIAIFLRSGIPLRTLAVVACTASLIRILSGAFTIRRTIALRRTLDEATQRWKGHHAHR